MPRPLDSGASSGQDIPMSNAEPKGTGARLHDYVRQNNGRPITPRQDRRIQQKGNRS